MNSAQKKLIFASILFFGLLFYTRTDASALTVDKDGNITIERSGEVLSKGSDNGDDEDEDKSGSSGSGSSGSGSDSNSGSSGSSGPSGSSGSGSSGSSGSPTTVRTRSTPKPTSTPAPFGEVDDDDDEGDEQEGAVGTVVRREVKDGRIETETILPNGVRVKTREEEGRVRTDIYQGGQKLRLERRGDRLVVKVENEEGEEVEIPGVEEDEIFKIEQRVGEGEVRVQSLGQKFVVSTNTIGAQTDFPVTIDLATNELRINTPAGERVVTVLPDQAVQNMLAANVIDQVRGTTFASQAERVATDAATTLQDVINLITTQDGVLAYEIPGIKSERFLGFIPIRLSKTAVVSAETGETLNVQQSFLSRVLDVLSF